MSINVEKILSDPSEYDGIAVALGDVPQDFEDLQEFCGGLTQIFGTLAKTEKFQTSDPRISRWLNEQFQDYIGVLLKFLEGEETSRLAFEALIKAVLIQGKYLKHSPSDLIQTIVSKQLASSSNDFDHCWLPLISKYDDLRFYFFRAAATAIPEVRQDIAKAKVFDLFEQFDNYPQSEYSLNKWYCGAPKVTKSSLKQGKGNMMSLESHKKSAQKAWLAFLNLPLNSTEVKKILTVLHARAIPNIAKPQLLMDFLTDAYNFGGSVALLALNSLFELIQKHNLDYPKFFTKLYRLLGDGSLFASTHRARFLRLLDLFLTSSHLPGTIPASIIKRMARLSLFSPPGAIIAIIPFIYNQLKRHPTCMVMIQRSATIQGPETDLFDASEQDPLKTRALESSLWELEALGKHYQPNVSALARIFSQPFHKPNYQLEHFLSHSYETLYSTQQKRLGRGGAALDYEEIKVFGDGFLDGWTA